MQHSGQKLLRGQVGERRAPRAQQLQHSLPRVVPQEIDAQRQLPVLGSGAARNIKRRGAGHAGLGELQLAAPLAERLFSALETDAAVRPNALQRAGILRCGQQLHQRRAQRGGLVAERLQKLVPVPYAAKLAARSAAAGDYQPVRVQRAAIVFYLISAVRAQNFARNNAGAQLHSGTVQREAQHVQFFQRGADKIRVLTMIILRRGSGVRQVAAAVSSREQLSPDALLPLQQHHASAPVLRRSQRRHHARRPAAYNNNCLHS